VECREVVKNTERNQDLEWTVESLMQAHKVLSGTYLDDHQTKSEYTAVYYDKSSSKSKE
jgi:hypothetical protein